MSTYHSPLADALQHERQVKLRFVFFLSLDISHSDKSTDEYLVAPRSVCFIAFPDLKHRLILK